MVQIILEGTDGVGKTTLANELTKVFNFKIVHFPLKGDPKKYNVNSRDEFILTMIDEMKDYYNLDRIIFDRWSISTIIYQKVTREEPFYYKLLSLLRDDVLYVCVEDRRIESFNYCTKFEMIMKDKGIDPTHYLIINYKDSPNLTIKRIINQLTKIEEGEKETVFEEVTKDKIFNFFEKLYKK